MSVCLSHLRFAGRTSNKKLWLRNTEYFYILLVHIPFCRPYVCVETQNIVRSHVHVYYSVCLQFIEVLGCRPWQVKNGDSQQFRERKLLGIPGNDFKVSIKSGKGCIYGCSYQARLHTPVLQK